MKIKKNHSKCSSCGGNLVYDAKSQNLFCNNCNRTIEIEKINCIDKKDYNLTTNTINNERKTTNCSSCGAQIEIKEREITKTCPYCNNNFVLEINEINGIKPDLIIPFQFNKEEAIEKYKLGVKKKFFLPNKFKKSADFSSIYGTYISSFSFDSYTKSTYNGRLSETETYTDSNGKSHSKTTYQNISGKKDIQFENIIAEASSLTNQKLFEEIKPYNINEKTTYVYNPDFIRGYAVETNDNSLENCKVVSENLMKEKIKKIILSKYFYDRVEYFNLNTTFLNNKYSYMLVPVYFININYKNKTYTTYLNGQTGKLGENLPKSKWKIALTIGLPILIFIIIFILANVLPHVL
ncbi:MAG: hypothetical protein E7359_00325 [Clostridiales bacterium]|nr:hypothetical protein [Clostridiales bacterium]